jgi:dipeptidyl aminopeptidase/acylaminoacyl peptidase
MKDWLSRSARGIALAWFCGYVASGSGFDASAPKSGGPAEQPAELFTGLPAIDGVKLSPSGRRLAFVVPEANGHRAAAVLDLDPIGTPRVVEAFSNGDVTAVDWVNDDRLLVQALDPDRGYGTFAVNHDGREAVMLHWKVGLGWVVHARLDDGSANVIVRHTNWYTNREARGFAFARLDTVSAGMSSLSAGLPDHVTDAQVDAEGRLRVLTTHDKGRYQIHWRADDGQPWKQLADFGDHDPHGLTAWRLDIDGSLIVSGRLDGDFEGLYRLEPRSRQLDPKPLLQVKGFDLAGDPVIDTHSGRLLGVNFVAGQPRTYWLDDRLDRIQRSIDAALPAGRWNRLLCSRCETSPYLVVWSASDRQPGEYYLYDRSKGALQRIGVQRPGLVEAQQGRRSFHRLQARDGLSLPVYVTHPVGGAPDTPLPTVVLVHGGPWTAGPSLRWNNVAQFLASRGYRVLEPAFRGTTGYGWEHFSKSWKHWGDTMQDDLADTVRWAVAQKLSDPGRVCVMGSSYGGYAALMSPIAEPGMFRCAVAFAAVTDLHLMYDLGWSDISEESKRYSMPTMIGDPDRDKELLDRFSPLLRASEIHVPVLLAHGREDRRVPIAHEQRFASAARAAKVPIEEVIYPEEGHGFWRPEDHADFLRKVQAFLKRSLAEPIATAAAH